MAKNLTQKIISNHLVEGEMIPGQEIAIRIDQTLTQDATGTMAYLQFEALNISRVQTELSVSYVDHNTLQNGFENADDHRFLQTIAAKHGIYFSRPGNGICHQVHVERFAKPGKTLLGSDSHTPMSGGMGCLAIGAGGLDVAVAMAGGPYYLKMPKVLGIHLTGKLQPWVAPKDVILEVLRNLTVKGGVGKVIEYYGEGVASLSLTDRATITNMGAELGATTSIFPSDEMTKQYLKAQGREGDWTPLGADEGCEYDEHLSIDLSELEPLVARPHSPDNVVKVHEAGPIPVSQVAVGSCTNSSFSDLMTVATLLKGKTVHPNVSLSISPGSKQVFTMIAQNGALADLIAAGGRILESACGPCIGMGMSPSSGSNSVRSFNRNFEGRSGTKDANVYLVSPETAAATALTGKLTDPRDLGLTYEKVSLPEQFTLDDNMVIEPAKNPEEVEIVRGPNIKPLPINTKLADVVNANVLLKVGDNITTDHIMPAGAKVLPLRSNIPAISEYVYAVIDQEFPKRCKEAGKGFIVGGANYGQGSSREHAALAPMYLGIKAVIVKSFARIHRQNLINVGILPLVFRDESVYEQIAQGDELLIENTVNQLAGDEIIVRNVTKDTVFTTVHDLSDRQKEIIKAGGLLNFTKMNSGVTI
ncbi:aconitate hydratase [Aneurinibacillus tyrosinisolvens]|uniref:aconitate hydratase n=1 Tax=Aneurinibacillus tyrosinisolvens TaxID=1443435 RepID=UPI00063F9E71|nr:aconitate hydratase [Aneurinibacillus tyrosinisolvens]